MITVNYNECLYLALNYRKATNIKPTGKWKLINREKIEFQVEFETELVHTVPVKFLGLTYKYIRTYERIMAREWVMEDWITFTETLEFDCNN